MSVRAPTLDSAAEAYERCMVPGLVGSSAKRMVEIADPRPGEHVLDAACGTGIGARLAAARIGAAGRVTGVDVDPAMVAVASRLFPASPPSEWHCASVHEMPVAAQCADLCLCLQGLQFFAERVAALQAIHRALKPSGRLVASMWTSLEASPAYHALVVALESQGVDAAAARKGYTFGEPAAVREAAAAAGFRHIELRSEQGCGRFASVPAFVDALAAGSVTARHSLAQLPEGGRDRLLRDIEQMLAPHVSPAGLEWPTRVTVLIASP